jgi:hypothetical protein
LGQWKRISRTTLWECWRAIPRRGSIFERTFCRFLTNGISVMGTSISDLLSKRGRICWVSTIKLHIQFSWKLRTWRESGSISHTLYLFTQVTIVVKTPRKCKSYAYWHINRCYKCGIFKKGLHHPNFPRHPKSPAP